MTAELLPGANALADIIAQEETAPGFAERVQVACGEGVKTRSILAPYYLTDLGVRQLSDPSQFFSAHVVHFGWTSPFVPSATHACLMRSDVDALARQLDALVLLVGDYTMARSVVAARMREILSSSDPVLHVYAGVAAASGGDPRCRNLFERASESEKPATAFTALHRLAAAELKRFGRPGEALDLLDRAERRVESERREGHLSAGDAASLRSVAANLRALAYLHLGRQSCAADELNRARESATLKGLVAVESTQVGRYMAQENINLAQMKVKSGAVPEAVVVLEQNLKFCEVNSPDYVSEAMSALAFALFLKGDHSAAARVATEAVARLRTEATPTRLLSARETLAASLYRLGRSDDAKAVMRAASVDPIGLCDQRDDSVDRVSA